ncbi:MMPL family transporter [Wenjunlia tyrosinilytica]|uniref:Membrane protein n=1 Tax=Wenjunlia tyrosinilytica TaxID=1544741 RepID=A0A917ZVV6_9ACTN|nr:MMPL family transporter [Wenjunlia tyrosinilytica]GGO92992.1 membrane protein [Wenjunlia tyrosinilytica]
MAALARWCLGHRLVVVILWVSALLGVAVTGTVAGTQYSNAYDVPGTESTHAIALLHKAFPQASGDTDTVVWKTDGHTHTSVRDEAVHRRMDHALKEISALPGVSTVNSPYRAEGSGQISRDGSTAYAQLVFDAQAGQLHAAQVKKVVDTAKSAQDKGLDVELGGSAISRTEKPPAHISEIVGLAAAAAVLLFAFGSLTAMLLPIITAVVSVGMAMLGIGLLSHTMVVAEFAPMLGMLIGLGVGIDYALFIVTRHRRGLKQGLSVQESAARAVNTSGRAVVFAGATVCIALLGMLVLRLSFLNGVAVAAAVTVVLTVLASVTLLPAMLGLLGPRVLSRRDRRRLAEHGPEPEMATGLAARWSAFVERHPRALAAVSAAVMLALAVPTLALHLGSSDQGNNPAASTTRKAYDMIAEGFGPGVNGPLQLVAETPHPGDRVALHDLVETLRHTPGVAAAQPVPTGENAGASIGIIEVVPTSAPQDQATDKLINHLRDDVIPEAEDGTTLDVHVGGVTATYKDFASVLVGKLPLFVGVIVALGFVLLLLAFRSLGVPLTAAAMNLLAAAASFGIVVAIFQWGWGAELIGVGRAGPIEPFLPVIMISILFGLSMDYQVFLVSRMHEEWAQTRDNRVAVRVGLSETSRVINSAAVIMICVFGAFVLSGDRVIGMFGIGLAAAVALDAFVLRTLLVPAIMHLLGRANWWLPGRLDRRLPRLTVEPEEESVEPVSVSELDDAPKQLSA